MDTIHTLVSTQGAVFILGFRSRGEQTLSAKIIQGGVEKAPPFHKYFTQECTAVLCVSCGHLCTKNINFDHLTPTVH